MEAVVLLYITMFMFALSGLLLMGAINKLSEANRLHEESRKIAMRALLLRKKV